MAGEIWNIDEIVERRCCVCGRELPHRDVKEYFKCCVKYRAEQIEKLKDYPNTFL